MCYICYHLQVLSQVKPDQKNKFINELQKNKNNVAEIELRKAPLTQKPKCRKGKNWHRPNEEIGTDPFAAQ